MRAMPTRGNAAFHIVDFDPTEGAGSLADAPLEVLDPAPVADWRGSSFDLLNGVEVLDHTDSIPDELFDMVFSDPERVGCSGGSSRG